MHRLAFLPGEETTNIDRLFIRGSTSRRVATPRPLKELPPAPDPPQTIITLPFQRAVRKILAAGAPAINIGSQLLVEGR